MTVFLLLFLFGIPGILVKAAVVPVYFDLEMTNVSRVLGEILQIGAIVGDKTHNQYVLPENDIPGTSSTLHHITKREGRLFVRGQEVYAVRIKDALEGFLEFLRDAAPPNGRVILVAHNGYGLDAPVILREMNRLNLLKPFVEIVAGFVDTFIVLSEEIQEPGRTSYSQAAMAQKFGISIGNGAHNALEDVRTLQKIIDAAGIGVDKLISYSKSIPELALGSKRKSGKKNRPSIRNGLYKLTPKVTEDVVKQLANRSLTLYMLQRAAVDGGLDSLLETVGFGNDSTLKQAVRDLPLKTGSEHSS